MFPVCDENDSVQCVGIGSDVVGNGCMDTFVTFVARIV